MRKPNSIKYTSYTEECCRFLTIAKEVETDALIPYFIQMQKLADDINQTFDYDGHQELASLEPARVETLVKAFRNSLTQLETTFTVEVWNHGKSFEVEKQFTADKFQRYAHFDILSSSYICE